MDTTPPPPRHCAWSLGADARTAPVPRARPVARCSTRSSPPARSRPFTSVDSTRSPSTPSASTSSANAHSPARPPTHGTTSASRASPLRGHEPAHRPHDWTRNPPAPSEPPACRGFARHTPCSFGLMDARNEYVLGERERRPHCNVRGRRCVDNSSSAGRQNQCFVFGTYSRMSVRLALPSPASVYGSPITG